MKTLLEEAVLFIRLTEMVREKENMKLCTKPTARNTMVQIKENLVLPKLLSRRQLP